MIDAFPVPTSSARSGRPPSAVEISDDRGRPHPWAATVDTATLGGRLPYHGIVSRGMLTTLGPGAFEDWPAVAPLIEDAWNVGRYRRDQARPEDVVGRMARSAERLEAHWSETCGAPAVDLVSGVRRHGREIAASALGADLVGYQQAVETALDADLGGRLGRSHEGPIRRLTQIREGRASSVWRLDVCPSSDDDANRGSIALNVARDLGSAADDLAAQAAGLDRICRAAPGCAAEILHVGIGRAWRFGRRCEVPVVATTWIPGSLEIHAIPAAAKRDRAELIAVDGFEPRADGQMNLRPASIRLDGDAVWRRVVELQTIATTIDWRRETVAVVTVDINDGDVVALGDHNAPDIRIVGTAHEEWKGPLGAWPYRTAAIHAISSADGSQHLFWWSPVEAIDAMLAGLRARIADGPPDAAGRLIDAAVRFEPGSGSDLIGGAPMSLFSETRQALLAAKARLA